MRGWRGAAAALLLGAGAAFAQAPARPAEPPAAADLLFETPQLANVPPGTALTYQYRRTGDSGGQLFGKPIDDRIQLKIEQGAKPEERSVTVRMFDGERRRAAGPFENTTANPVLLLFLEHNLDDLARVLGANPRYLKNAIRAGLRDHATVTPATTQVAGKAEPGWIVEVQPFLDDPKKERMKGLHTLRFRFESADAVPGRIVSIRAEADAPGGKLLEESLTYESLD